MMSLLDSSLLFESLSLDLVWLRGFNFTHFLVIVAFYWLWRLPGHHRSSGGGGDSSDVWYDALQEQQPLSSYESDLSDDEDSKAESDRIPATDDAWLQNQVPESTAAERIRFFVARGHHRVKAAQALRIYTNWRREYDIPLDPQSFINTQELTEDERIWNEVSLIALKARKERQCDLPLPKIVHLHKRRVNNTANTEKEDTPDSYIRDKTGRRIIHFLPGRMDDRLASTVTYALAVALYVDRCLDRESQELVTVVIDTRGGRGWRNLNAAQLLPFIQHLSKLMLTMFPQRLYRAVVFPIPSTFYWVWRMARNCIDVVTREKICPLEGPSTIDSPPPMDEIASFLGDENALLIEANRKAGFLSPTVLKGSKKGFF